MVISGRVGRDDRKAAWVAGCVGVEFMECGGDRVADGEVGLKRSEAIRIAGGQLDVIAGGGEFPCDSYGHIGSGSE